jgi:spore coat protein JB
MLFDNDMDYNFFDMASLNNDINNYNNNLYSAKEGFLRGNMYTNEYDPYKNLTFISIKPRNEREVKMFNIMQYSFAINDLNLYLDLHPEDKEVLNLLKEYIEEEKNAKKEYESIYGPLEVCDVKGSEFDWINSPWSWEKDNGGGMYV